MWHWMNKLNRPPVFGAATEKMSHSIAEYLILPVALDMVSAVFDETFAEEIKCIPWVTTVFPVQLDESLNVSNLAALSLYITYVWEY